MQPLAANRGEERGEIVAVGVGGGLRIGVLLTLAEEHRAGREATRGDDRLGHRLGGEVEQLPGALRRPVGVVDRRVQCQGRAPEHRLDDVERLAGMGGAEVDGELDLGPPALWRAGIAGVHAGVHRLEGVGLRVPDQRLRIGAPAAGHRRGVLIGRAHVGLAGEHHHDTGARARRRGRSTAATRGAQRSPGQASGRHMVDLDDVIRPLRAGSHAVAVEQQLGPAGAVVKQCDVVVGHRIGPGVAGLLQQRRQVELVGAQRKIGDADGRPGLDAHDEAIGARAAGQHVSALTGIERIRAGAAVQGGIGPRRSDYLSRGRAASSVAAAATRGVVIDDDAGRRGVAQRDARGIRKREREGLIGLHHAVARDVDGNGLAGLTRGETGGSLGQHPAHKIRGVGRTGAGTRHRPGRGGCGVGRSGAGQGKAEGCGATGAFGMADRTRADGQTGRQGLGDPGEFVEFLPAPICEEHLALSVDAEQVAGDHPGRPVPAGHVAAVGVFVVAAGHDAAIRRMPADREPTVAGGHKVRVGIGRRGPQVLTHEGLLDRVEHHVPQVVAARRVGHIVAEHHLAVGEPCPGARELTRRTGEQRGGGRQGCPVGGRAEHGAGILPDHESLAWGQGGGMCS